MFYLIAGISVMFNRMVYYFASEMRPYSLWASLSFLFIFSLLAIRNKTSIWLFVPILLSLTATASLYQLIPIIFGIFLVHYKVKTSGWKSSFSEWTGIVLIVCLAINGYYISKITAGGYPPPAWSTFWDFWREYLLVAILGLGLALIFYQQKQTHPFITSLGASGWILFGPVSFKLTQMKTFFFDPRQYIYYVPATAAILFCAFVSLTLKNRSRAGYGFSLVATLIILFTSFRQTTYGFQFALTRIRTPVEITMPVNFTKLKPFIPDNIPQTYDFSDVDPDPQVNSLSLDNWQIYWQYLNDIYPPQKYPRRPDLELKIRSRGLEMEITDISSR
jgi:hypothetical protein